MKKSILGFLPLLFFTLPPPSYADAPAVDYTVAYFGEMLTHPGGLISVGSPLQKSSKGFAHGLHFGISLGFFLHPQNSTNLFILPEISYFIQTSPGFYADARVGWGRDWLFPGGTVYEVQENGSVQKESFVSHSFWMPTTSLAAGWKSKGENFSYTPFLCIGLANKYPQANTLEKSIALQIGTTIAKEN